MTVADLADVVRLFESLHWPYTRRDMRPPLRLATRRLVRCRGGRDLRRPGDGAAPRLGQGAVGLVTVEESRRERGTGTRLTQAALDFLLSRGATQVRLDATEMGVEIYERMGFSRSAMSITSLAISPPRQEGAGPSHLLSATSRRAGRVRRTNIRSRPGRTPRRACPGQRGVRELPRREACRLLHDACHLRTARRLDRPSHRGGRAAAARFSTGRRTPGGARRPAWVPAPNGKACKALEEFGFSCDFVLTRMYYGDQTSRESLQAVWAEAGSRKGLAHSQTFWVTAKTFRFAAVERSASAPAAKCHSSAA